MKKALKKLSAIVLAVTLLGTGTTISQNSNHSIEAHAASCNHYNWRRYATYGNWTFDYYMCIKKGQKLIRYGEVQERNIYIKCVNCSDLIHIQKAYRTIYY